MIAPKSFVIYKSSPAEVISYDAASEKYGIRYRAASGTLYRTQSVREKDIEFLCAGEASLDAMLSFAKEAAEGKHPEIDAGIRDCAELLSTEGVGASYSLKELATLFRGSFKADEAWGIYTALKASPFFRETLPLAFSPRTREEIEEAGRKARQKVEKVSKRAAFILRLKKREILPSDSIFMGDVEALALGKSDKSRTMKEAGIRETPEDAHRLLLETGVWDVTRNPYPARWGLSAASARAPLPPPPPEERVLVPGNAYAIDNAWSSDPDDAVAWDGEALWVHIADPAAAVSFGSDIERTACARGATLYMPEGAARMIAEEALSDWALGLKEESPALSFKMRLSNDGAVEDCEVLKTLVRVKRLTYEEADANTGSPELSALFGIAERARARRIARGAVDFDIGEVYVSVDGNKRVSLTRVVRTKSADMVKEMMILTGEGAARFAFKRGLPFPYVTQEAPDTVKDLPPGLAGAFRLRRTMRRRSLGVTPGSHAGLGVGMYAQVTSPLRRYTDLISHIQLRASLARRPLIDKDTLLMRISEGDAAAVAAKRAERNSNLHWTLVYLLQNPDWEGDAVCVDKLFRNPLFYIPDLGIESYIPSAQSVELNGIVRVKVKKIDIPTLYAEFTAAH